MEADSKYRSFEIRWLFDIYIMYLKPHDVAIWGL